jgi:hypothetical protein
MRCGVFAEEATGIRERAPSGGQLYSGDGEAVTDKEARALLLAGRSVHAPNAGAGSYAWIARRLGLRRPVALNLSSSAGDWEFAVGDKVLVQSNRYPRFGFVYNITEAT